MKSPSSPFDHLLLVKRHPVECERFRALIRRTASNPGAASLLRVEHEADDSCCAREPWPVTLTTLLASGDDDHDVGRSA